MPILAGFLAFAAALSAALGFSLFRSGEGFLKLLGLIFLLCAPVMALVALLAFRRRPRDGDRPASRTQLAIGNVLGVLLGAALLVQAAKGITTAQFPGWGKRAPVTLFSKHPGKYLAKLAVYSAGGAGLVWFFLPALRRSFRAERESP